jgi:hypothetical protein
MAARSRPDVGGEFDKPAFGGQPEGETEPGRPDLLARVVGRLRAPVVAGEFHGDRTMPTSARTTTDSRLSAEPMARVQVSEVLTSCGGVNPGAKVARSRCAHISSVGSHTARATK